MDLSVIIVNYNTKKLTMDAIQSVLNSKTKYKYEIIVVDNNSSDGSVGEISSRFPQVKIIVNNDNAGFAKANNQGINQSDGRYILLLNSDTIIQKDTIEKMMVFMEEHPDVGAGGCKVVLPDGSLDKACHRGFPTPSASFYYLTGLSKKFPDNPRFSQYHLSHLNLDEIHEVDCLVGAFMLVRREAIDHIGLLDETFFMYGEDIDWCYRIKKSGWKIYYYPYTSIIHYKGASSRKKPQKIVYEFHRAMYLFHKKHYAHKYSVFINALVYIGVSLKLIFSATSNAVRKIGD
ncbi:GT2 family glycosyltransferase [Bacillus fengqiuensis]|nr:GT2 family glycosyltransferase [Bacillus fengqiuensis]